MTTSTEEAQRLAERLAHDAEAPQSARYQPYTDHAMQNAAIALRSLAAERDALQAEKVNLQDDLSSAERERAHQHGRADRNAAKYAREQGKREALQKRVAELETALQFIKDAPDEERKPNFDNMGSYESGLRYCAAFAGAALEGKKE